MSADVIARCSKTNYDDWSSVKFLKLLFFADLALVHVGFQIRIMPRQNLQRFGTIVQARMGSARAPGKVLSLIKGRPLLEYVVQSVKPSRVVGELIIATSDGASDDAIADWCNLHRVTCYRGSEENVADRFFQLAKAYGWDAFFRVSADSPCLLYTSPSPRD